MSKANTNFAAEIKRLREARGLNKGQLAAYANISRSTISMWELGKRRSPSPKLLERVAPYLGVDLDYLLVLAGHRREPSGTMIRECLTVYEVDGTPLTEDEVEIAGDSVRHSVRTVRRVREKAARQPKE